MRPDRFADAPPALRVGSHNNDWAHPLKKDNNQPQLQPPEPFAIHIRKLHRSLHHMVEIWGSALNATLSGAGKRWENRAFQQTPPKMIRRNTAYGRNGISGPPPVYLSCHE
jgi:hypothetical protein